MIGVEVILCGKGRGEREASALVFGMNRCETFVAFRLYDYNVLHLIMCYDYCVHEMI